jgi:hypothetical protein
MPYNLPQDSNSINFFGKKTVDGNDAFMPIENINNINSFAVTELTINNAAVELKTSLLNRKTITILCDGIIYIGPDATVTAGGGFPLTVGEKITFNIKQDSAAKIFAISDTSSRVRIIETN